MDKIYKKNTQGQFENACNSKCEPPLKVKMIFFRLNRDVQL